MKKSILLLSAAVFAFVLGYSQPVTNLDKIDAALATNGSHGSTNGNGATFEIALKTSQTYPSTPVAEDFIVYVMAPNSILTGSETITLYEYSNVFGTGTTMSFQGAYLVGTNTYFAFALNGATGLNLSNLPLNTWKYAFTFGVSPQPSKTNRALFTLVDRLNNAELSGFAGTTVYTRVLLGGNNLLTASSVQLLPTSLQNFNVTKKNNAEALLTWGTNYEDNVSHFTVEKSKSETSGWSAVTTVKAKGFSTTPTSYTYTDNKAFDGNAGNRTVFYRIRSVDLDGKELIFPIRSVQFTAGKGITIYPNPVKDGFNIQVPVLNPADKKIRMNLVNQAGQTLHIREISATQAANYYYDIKTPGVINGEYMLQILLDGELLDTKKILVQH